MKRNAIKTACNLYINHIPYFFKNELRERMVLDNSSSLSRQEYTRTTVIEEIANENGYKKELYHSSEVRYDCEGVQAILWRFVNCIMEKREIFIEYYRSDWKWVAHCIRSPSVMFLDYYFYPIVLNAEGTCDKPIYFRVDRIKHITEYCKKFTQYGSAGVRRGFT